MDDDNKLIKAIEKLKGEYESDIEFDEITTSEILLKIPSLKSKWISKLTIHEVKLYQLKQERDILIERLISEIQDKSTKPISINAATNIARKQSRYVSKNNEIKEMEMLVQYLVKINTNMQSMTWEMKNYIDDKKRDSI